MFIISKYFRNLRYCEENVRYCEENVRYCEENVRFLLESIISNPGRNEVFTKGVGGTPVSTIGYSL